LRVQLPPDAPMTIYEELKRNTMRAGFCTCECGTTKEDCRKCKEAYIKDGLEYYKNNPSKMGDTKELI